MQGVQIKINMRNIYLDNAGKLSLEKTSLIKEYLFMQKGKPKATALSGGLK